MKTHETTIIRFPCGSCPIQHGPDGFKTANEIVGDRVPLDRDGDGKADISIEVNNYVDKAIH